MANVHLYFILLQILEREEVAAAEEAPDRVGTEEGLEGLLGVPQGHHSTVLPLRLARGSLCRGSAQAPYHRRWRHHAAHP